MAAGEDGYPTRPGCAKGKAVASIRDTGTEELLCAIDDAGVATVTLNRPEKRNALSDRLSPALRRVLRDLDTDDAVRCVLLTGAGNAFCAGGDIGGMGAQRDAAGPAPSTAARVRELAIRQETLVLRLWELSKPTIAALPGPAAGAGLSIALACDLRVMAESTFVTTAFRNIGFCGDYGGSWFLTRLVGPARAKDLYYTARRVGAAECLALGIVDRVFPDAELRTSAEALAKEIAAGPPLALGNMKSHIHHALAGDLRTALALEAEHTVRLAGTEDHREAVAAFMAKRPPEFHGR